MNIFNTKGSTPRMSKVNFWQASLILCEASISLKPAWPYQGRSAFMAFQTILKLLSPPYFYRSFKEWLFNPLLPNSILQVQLLACFLLMKIKGCLSGIHTIAKTLLCNPRFMSLMLECLNAPGSQKVGYLFNLLELLKPQCYVAKWQDYITGEILTERIPVL